MRIDLTIFFEVTGSLTILLAFFLLYSKRKPIKRWIRRRENIFLILVGILLWLVTIVVTGYFYYFRQAISLNVFLGAVFGCIFFLLSSLIYLRKREKTVFITLTSKYLLEKDEAKIDELLGILVAGKWETLKVDPVVEFFKSLHDICVKGDVETRRLISEALPVLFRIDIDEGKSLVQILRQDWDELKWKADNRRRTIESLAYIVKEEKTFVNDNLHVKDGDEIYTLIAVAEILVAWEQTHNKKGSDSRFQQLIREMEERSYSDDELKAVAELREFLNLIRSDRKGAARKCGELKDSGNIYTQVCVARNFKYLCTGFSECRIKKTTVCNGSPELITGFMEYFLGEQKHKHVRRPIAKEDYLACLIVLLRHQKYGERAKEIIWKLIKDSDVIIRVTAFDRIENILEVDEDFGRNIIRHVIDTDYHEKLVGRAKRIMARYGI